MGCPCKVTSAFLAMQGATLSARMHREPYTVFSRDEWLRHFEEEEQILLPLLREHGFAAEASRILREHHEYRSQPVWTSKSLKAHARFEDEAVLALVRAMGIPEEQVQQWRLQ